MPNMNSLKHRKTAYKAVFALAAVLLLTAVVVFYFNNEYLVKGHKYSSSGILGKVFLGPLSPVVREGDQEPNAKPYPKAEILVKVDQENKVLTTVVSDDNGEFEVNLLPGSYKLEPMTPKGQVLPIGSPQTVVVEPNAFTEVIIHYDTGIR